VDGGKFAIDFFEDVGPNLEIDAADLDDPPPNPPILGDFRAKIASTAGYKLMAGDKERETEALGWAEALIGDGKMNRTSNR
jgi:hypothetical protein